MQQFWFEIDRLITIPVHHQPHWTKTIFQKDVSPILHILYYKRKHWLPLPDERQPMILNRKEKRRELIQINDSWLHETLFKFEIFPFTRVNLFVNRWHKILCELCKRTHSCNPNKKKKKKTKWHFFLKRMLRNEKLRLGDTSCCRLSLGRMALKSPSFHFLFLECVVMIKYTVSSFHLTWKWKRKKK